MNFLTKTEREHLKLQHRRERGGRIHDRIKAVLFYDEGGVSKDIARVLLTSCEAVRNHIDEYQTLEGVYNAWKWMKERVIYNTYYEHFEDFKGAIFSFFAVLSVVNGEPILGQALRGQMRDKFRPIKKPATNF